MTYTRLAWDSDFFGLDIARVVTDAEEPKTLPALARSADADGVDCLYLLADLGDQALIEAALGAGFRPFDVRIELTWRPNREVLRPVASIRSARPEDRTAVLDLAQTAFVDTRFSVDPGFAADRVNEMYRIWAARAFDADSDQGALVTDDRSGFISYSLNRHEREATIQLLATSPQTRGHGLGRALVVAATEVFTSAGMTGASVVTQGRAIAAQRAYQAAGFRTAAMSLWLHRWSTG